MTYITKEKLGRFAEATAIRALRSFVQAVVVSMPATGAILGEMNIPLVLSTACGYALASVLTSCLVGLPEVDDETLASILDGDNAA